MSLTVTHNPFATRFLRPGAIPFLFSDGSDLGAFVSSFVKRHCFGQIVGPHGCGKSTLCFAMADRLKSEFACVKYVTIRSAKDVDVKRYRDGVGESSVLTIVDGLERLALLQQQLMIKHLLKMDSVHGVRNGLLITSHRPIKFVPMLTRLEPSFEAFKSVVDYLDPKHCFDAKQLKQVFEQTHGNIREALMVCYDLHASLESQSL